jgi:hypothetical protein
LIEAAIAIITHVLVQEGHSPPDDYHQAQEFFPPYIAAIRAHLLTG